MSSATDTEPVTAGRGLDGKALSETRDAIAEALGVAGDRVPAEVHDRAQIELERVAQRLELGVGHTVVALVGGTGSGKSSMFNALSGLDFADVGVIRPTTAQAAACTWGTKATGLLDFLGVADDRRIQRDSVLDRDEHQDLHGLVLLDLPDHDSVERSHARQVDRLLPLVDLLVWVVDPQKYADNVLHEGYLRSLAGREDAIAVVVNQIDTLPSGSHDRVREDVARLLAEDGLDDVQILLTSVREGIGLDPLRERIAQVRANPSVTARTARAQLDATIEDLSAYLGPAQPEPDDPETTAEELATAAGVAAVSESIRAAVANPREVALSPTQHPARSRIDAIRERWLAKATAGLPELWRRSAIKDVPPAQPFYDHVWEALQGVALPASSDRSARRWRIVGHLLLVVGVLGVGAGAALWFLSTTGTLPTPDAAAWITGGAGAVLLVTGVVLIMLARKRRRATAAQRASGYLAEVTERLRSVVVSDLVEPSSGPLAEHHQVLQVLRGD